MFAMVSSFILSRTLVPTMAMFLLKPHDHHAQTKPTRNPFVLFQRAFEYGFEKFRVSYHGLLQGALHHPRAGPDLLLRLYRGIVPFGAPTLGRNFFRRSIQVRS